MDKESSLNLNDFSIVSGGPFYKLIVRLRLVETGSHHAFRRALLFILITWLPLLVLSTLKGVALGSTVKIPFLIDFAVSARYLIAGPLLIIAEILIDPRLRIIVNHFVSSGLVKEEDLPQFESSVKEVSKLRDFAPVELILISIIIIYSFLGLRAESLSGGVSTWNGLASGSDQRITLAGWWFVVVSQPLFQFILLRWLWKLCIWSRFLWCASRINLNLIPTHPDMAGGLGFLGSGQAQFGIIVLALSIIFSAGIGEKIIFGGESLASFKVIIIAYVVLQLVIFLGPLLVFSPLLLRIKNMGLLDYGALATEYTQSFDNKWVRGKAPDGETLLGSSDIQSLADLANSFQVVNKMGFFLFSRSNVIFIVAAAAIPMFPLLLTVISLEQIISKILNLLF
jgi:hypothetical protein